ncbi:MAG TPA: 23S rRNA (adenine(2503)-C(2))-methyltransferase RlmN [bacterium]|nr:23S rRNA (adenine(2503)-C(2))-methyltransferase RlmN [bacterium]
MELFELTRPELEEAVAAIGMKPFRGRQIFRWLYQELATDISMMTDISKSGREELAQRFTVRPLTAPEVFTSADGTEKLRFTLDDGAIIEAVIIPEKGRVTLCVSTQVGCPLGCLFCRTGSLGFSRDLTVREIVGQHWAAQKRLAEAGKRVTNIVFMGMGEPLLNLASTVKSARIMMDDLGFNLSNRRVTISTVGIPDKLDELGGQVSVNLALSLHAVTDEKRRAIMPATKNWPLKELLAALRRFPLPPRKKILIEYVLLRGVNDSPAEARQLVKIARSLNAKINLIPFNTFDGAPYEPSIAAAIQDFQQAIWDAGLTVIIRKSRGDESLAACGQLGYVPDTGDLEEDD